MAIKTSLKNPEWEILEGLPYVICDGCHKKMQEDEEFYALQGWMPIVMLNSYFCEDCYPQYKEHCCCDECDQKWQTRAKCVLRSGEFAEDSETMKWAKKVLKVE